MTTDLLRFTKACQQHPKRRWTSLVGMLFRLEGLADSYRRLAPNKAPGVDGIRKVDYAKGLKDRIEDLSVRLRQMGYRPKPSRRVYIPKASGGQRPLGIPSFEDRIVQDRLSQILQAIWEPEFRECSYGFRPDRSAHGALRRVAEVITNEQTQWVVEADIKGFFNHVSHNHLMRFLKHRIRDPRLLRIIQRFLRAGILEDGAIIAGQEGTPQGGLVSPVLANIYLHYVLDWWFEGKYAMQCRGKAHLIRYADDFVACFQYENDARDFLQTLQERLGEFDLETEPSKTKLLRFGSGAMHEWQTKRADRPESFDFLGFTHYVTSSRKGRFMVGRKTQRKRASRKLKELSRKLRSLRVKGGHAMLAYVRRHLQGHIQYYGVSGNTRALRQYCCCAGNYLFKWWNRRSQKRSLTWAEFAQLLRGGLLPRPRIVHNLYPAPVRMT
jgi:RNA-directed DNA polymerase